MPIYYYINNETIFFYNIFGIVTNVVNNKCIVNNIVVGISVNLYSLLCVNIVIVLTIIFV